jgi:dihydrofolate reductase
MISLIYASDEQGLIGRDNDLPWRLPADLRHFKRTTMGKPLIMGRKTHESIGRPLPGRLNIVVTRQVDYTAPGCTVVHSIDAAREAAADAEEVMVIGGADIYRLFLPVADRLYHTEVHETFDGDVFFPDVDRSAWVEVSRDAHPADDRNPYAYTFVVLDRR